MSQPLPLIQAVGKLPGSNYQQLLVAIQTNQLKSGPAPSYLVTMEDVIDWAKTYEPSLVSTINRKDFISRFTSDEQKSMATNPEALVWWLNLVDMPRINLADPKIIADVTQLTTLGVLSPGRQAVILSI